FDLGGARRDLRLHERANGVAQHADVFAQIEIDARDVQGDSSVLIGPEPTPVPAPLLSKRLHFPPSLARIFHAVSNRDRDTPPRRDPCRLRPRRGGRLCPPWAGSSGGPEQGAGHSRPRQIDGWAGNGSPV